MKPFSPVRWSVRAVLKLIYGVRGGIKPPLRGPNAGLIYLVRLHWWAVVDRLYRWSGLPDEWFDWYMQE